MHKKSILVLFLVGASITAEPIITAIKIRNQLTWSFKGRNNLQDLYNFDLDESTK